jgi:ceramide glucosyltransferase
MTAISTVLVALSLVSVVYWAWAAWRVTLFQRRRPAGTTFAPPVSVLKPLRGDHEGLYESLRSFCEQDYPCFQVVFGVGDPRDPAAAVALRLIRELPGSDLLLVTDAAPVGANPKVSNVVNAYKSARHDVIVVADSDVRVDRGYLRQIVGPLADPGTGLVTCLYRARPTAGLSSRLGAMYINDWFFPSAIMAAGLEPLTYAFGATMASRRGVIDAIGGFENVADYLADDYVLGRTIAETGRRVELSSHVVETTVDEPSLAALCLHELRWARTIRSVRPVGYLLSGVTFGVTLAGLALACSGPHPATAAALGANLLVRLPGRSGWRSIWLIPIREPLSFTIWLLAFCGRTVRWYGETFALGRHSFLRGRNR